MDEQLLQDLFDLTTEGAFSSFEEFKSFIETDGENAFNDIYELTIDGAFGSQDEYNTFISPLKKKDSSQSTVISPQENTELPSPTETTPVSSELPVQAEEINISGINAPGAEPEGQEEIDEIILDTQTSDEDITEIDLSGERYGRNIESGEDKFWFEEMLGNVPVVSGVTDFFGDMIRAGEQGFSQGATIDDAVSLYSQGSSMSSEDMAQYIAAVKKMDSMPMSDEMKSFNKIYKKNGGGILGFILGVGSNPTVTGQLLVSSIASMVNPTVLGGGAAGAATGAGVGAAAGSVGGPLAAFTAAGGGIAGGLMGMGATLEFGLSYTEFLREEITKKGLKFDEAGIRKILSDPEAVQSIRNKAAARGLVIGAIDGLTAGVAGKVGASLTKAGIAAGKSAIKAGGKGALATTVIEGAGGAGGEAAARAVTGQEMDVAEIGFEGITGQASGVLTIPQAAFGMSSTDIVKKGYNEGMNIFKPPAYKIGNDKMTKAEIEKFVDTATLEEVEAIQFNVKNDPVLEQKIKDLKVKAENNKILNPKIQGQDRSRILDLEVQLANLGNLEMESTKIEAQKIKSEIKEITERALSSDTKVEPTKKDLELAKEQLISEGIVEPSPEQIKAKANAIQDSAINEKISVAETGKNEKADGFNKAPVYKTGGKPVLFHGSTKKFTEFDIEKIGSGADAGTARGIFFTSDPEVASFFSKETGSFKGNVIQSIKSLTGKSQSTIYSGALNTDNIKTVDFNGQRTSPGFDKNKTIQEAFNQGFEAVILKNIVDGNNKVQDVTVVKDMSVIDGFKDTQSSGNKLIKKYKQDAIQESSAKGVDVRQQTGDGQTVVKGDTTGAVTNQSQKETEGQTQNKETEVDSLAINDSDSVKKESYGFTRERIEGQPDENFTIEVVTNKDGSRTFRYKLEDGSIYTTEKVSKNNTLTNEQYIEVSETVEPGTLKLTETVEGFENIANKSAVARRKKLIAEQNKQSTLVAGQEQIREDISKPYIAGNTEVKFNPDGTVKEILKKGTKTPASKVAKSKAEKNVLKNKIDVNAGKIFTPSNDSKITPEQYSQEVADNSTNIRQIAETIKNDTKKYRSLDKKEQLQMLDPSDILSIKISEQDFNRYGDSNLITPEIRKNWFKKPDKNGNIINDLDTVVMETPGLEVENVIDFIVNNPKRKINVKQGKPSVVRELETKFKELTGINPTPTNIDTVVNISPDAQPLAVIKEKDKASLEIAEEPTKNKKGVKNPKKILGDKPKKVTVNEKVALKDQIKLEAKAAREAKRSVITEQKLKRKRKIAKKNIGAKLGVISVDLDTALQTLFSIDPDLIPDKQLDSYADLVKEFGDNKRVLNLNDKAVTLEKALDIIDAVEMEVEVDEEGVLVKEEKVDNYDLNQEVKEIRANKITNEELNNISDSRSREIAREINKFSKQDIDGLVKENKKGEKNYGLVNTLKAVKNNIKNGFVPRAALEVLTEVNSNKADNKVTPVVEKVTKPGIYRHLRSFYNSAKVAITSNSPSGKNLLLDRLRSSPTFFIDDIFGNFNSKTIYNNTFKKLAVAYESFKTEVSRAENKIKDADKLLRSKSRNKTVKAKYKLRILQLQREYLSNIIDGKANPKAPPALDFIDATMEAIKDGEALSPSDLKILQELRAEFLVDNEISLDKLNKSLTTKEKQALALYDEVSGSTAEKAVFISSTLYGNRVNLLNDYTHHSVITKSDIEADFDRKTKRFVNSSTNTKAGTIVERTPGAKPISFDPSYSALRGVQETLLDYEMTQVNREVAKTVNKMKSKIKSDPNSTMAQNDAANALVKSLNEVNKVLFGNTFADVGAGGVLLNRIKTLGYQAALSSVPRAVGELVGNMGLMLMNPVASARAFKNFGGLVLNPKNTTLGMDIMDNLNSSETSKLFDTENMQSKYSNMTDFMQTSQASGSAVGSVQNAMGIIMNLGLNQTAAGINTMANKLMSYPDQAISRPLWFGSFADSFAKATKELNGKEIKLTVEDYKKIGDGTSQYLTPEFKEARESAKNTADANAITVATSTNPYNTILKNMPRTTDKGFLPLYRQANSYMARFSLFEYGTARNAIGALYKSGDISRTQAVGLLSGVIFRMSSYVAVYSVLSSIMDEELFDAKDDKEEDIEDILMRQTVGSVLTLLTRGNLGNIPSIPINFMLESMVNEPFLGDLRNNEEYDPYKHSIVFSQLNKEDLQKKNLAEIGMKIFAGPYGPMLATALRTGTLAVRSQLNKTQESRDKNLEELTNRMSFEALGNSGLIPFYKDIRRALVKKRFNKPKPLTKTQLKELKKNYPEYFQDNETKTSAGSRKSRTQSKGSGRRTRKQSR